jgi:hypothetical protein
MIAYAARSSVRLFSKTANLCVVNSQFHALHRSTFLSFSSQITLYERPASMKLTCDKKNIELKRFKPRAGR